MAASRRPTVGKHFDWTTAPLLGNLPATHIGGAFRANSEADARAVADADPMHKAGARTYVIRQWMMNEGRFRMSVDYGTGTYSVE